MFVTSIAMRLDDLGVTDGAHIGIDIPGAASWTLWWRAPETRWDLTPGLAGDAVATITIRAPTALRLFSRRPVSTENADVITTSGDGDVGAAALVRMGQLFT